MSKSFVELAPSETGPRSGVCAECLAKNEAYRHTLEHPIRETYIADVELTPPRPVREAVDDEGPQVIDLPYIREPGE